MIHHRNGNLPVTGTEKVKNLFKYNAYVSEAKQILFANRSIILFVSDFIHHKDALTNRFQRYM